MLTKCCAAINLHLFIIYAIKASDRNQQEFWDPKKYPKSKVFKKIVLESCKWVQKQPYTILIFDLAAFFYYSPKVAYPSRLYCKNITRIQEIANLTLGQLKKYLAVRPSVFTDMYHVSDFSCSRRTTKWWSFFEHRWGKYSIGCEWV